MICNPNKECMSRDEMSALQSKRLRNIVKYVYHHVPFYRHKLQELDIRPEDIQTIEDIEIKDPDKSGWDAFCGQYETPVKDFPLEVQATICMALSFSAYMAETIRGAILSVDGGQMEACITTGMSTFQAYRYVVLPQAFRLAVPSLMNNFIECFKGSSLCSMVGVTDMMLKAKMIANKTYRFIEVYLAVLILYWALNMLFGYGQKLIERKLSAKYYGGSHK